MTFWQYSGKCASLSRSVDIEQAIVYWPPDVYQTKLLNAAYDSQNEMLGATFRLGKC